MCGSVWVGGDTIASGSGEFNHVLARTLGEGPISIRQSDRPLERLKLRDAKAVTKPSIFQSRTTCEVGREWFCFNARHGFMRGRGEWGRCRPPRNVGPVSKRP